MELSNYKTLFPEKFTAYAENGEVFFKCDLCGERPTEETRSDPGLLTQVYMTCPCYTGSSSYATVLLDEMREYAQSLNLL